MVTQKYITWNRYWVNEYRSTDPDIELSKLWPIVTFTKLPMGDTLTDKRMLALVSYEDGALSSDAWTRFKLNFSHYCFYEVTAQVAWHRFV
jgi:hypothetical protein